MADPITDNADEQTPTVPYVTPPDSAIASLGGGGAGGWGNAIANSIASTIGYGTRNQGLQDQSIRNMDEDAKMRLLAPAGKAFGEVQARLAAGDLDGANREYQKIAHLSLAIPAVGALGTKLGEQALGIENRKRMAAAIANPDYIAGTRVPAKPATLSGNLNPGEDEEAAAYLPRIEGTPARPGTPIDNRQIKLSQLVTLGVDPDKATKMIYPDLQHIQLDDGSIGVMNPRSGQVFKVYNGMGKVAGENLLRPNGQGGIDVTQLPKTQAVPHGSSLVQTGPDAQGNLTGRVVYQGVNGPLTDEATAKLAAAAGLPVRNSIAEYTPQQMGVITTLDQQLKTQLQVNEQRAKTTSQHEYERTLDFREAYRGVNRDEVVYDMTTGYRNTQPHTYDDIQSGRGTRYAVVNRADAPAIDFAVRGVHVMDQYADAVTRLMTSGDVKPGDNVRKALEVAVSKKLLPATAVAEYEALKGMASAEVAAAESRGNAFRVGMLKNANEQLGSLLENTAETAVARAKLIKGQLLQIRQQAFGDVDGLRQSQAGNFPIGTTGNFTKSPTGRLLPTN
jgi:hypothetical protein